MSTRGVWRDYPTTRSEYPWRRSLSPHRTQEPGRQAGPDAAYLALAAQSSTTTDGASARKLLVLDLNGTLLLRGHRSRFGSTVGRLRTVYPRPYIPAFREYLFTPKTRQWLDTMVWSSAQPHSVQDMVHCVFGPDSDDLVAVWDRTSLGLSSVEYHQKSVTAKDLSKPWKSLPLDDTESSSIRHSALTTLLLDDSPHKAMLQPYNHVCIPEYDSSRRKLDLDSLQLGLTTESRSQIEYRRHGALENEQVAGQAHTEPVDATLLAVVGILDEIKRQTNVAGWIRAGGLWGRGNISHATTSPSAASSRLSNQEQPTESAKRRKKKKRRLELAGREQATVVDGDDTTGNDAYTTSELVTPDKELVPSSLWFQDPPTVAYWVARGRRALHELGIAVEHGVSP
ncbi:hypothetical protein EDC04DRAFT_2916490 [Pisolithus marmoratus]|nr:hypothetical protein EDC04DRAFT_2916490 [Pisolithus marmoratus]